MTHYAVGQSTKTVYAKGTKADCLRKLQAEFPSLTNRNGKAIGSILPETVMIIRRAR